MGVRKLERLGAAPLTPGADPGLSNVRVGPALYGMCPHYGMCPNPYYGMCPHPYYGMCPPLLWHVPTPTMACAPTPMGGLQEQPARVRMQAGQQKALTGPDHPPLGVALPKRVA